MSAIVCTRETYGILKWDAFSDGGANISLNGDIAISIRISKIAFELAFSFLAEYERHFVMLGAKTPEISINRASQITQILQKDGASLFNVITDVWQKVLVKHLLERRGDKAHPHAERHTF